MDWPVIAVALAALINLALTPVVPRRVTYALFVLWLSLALTLTFRGVIRPALPGMFDIAWVCASLALFWSLGQMTVKRVGRAARRWRSASVLARLAGVAALVTGVTAGSLATGVLLLRVRDLAVELFTGIPAHWAREFGFAPAGMGIWVLLGLAAGLAAVAGRSGRLATTALWSTTGLVSWACLLLPAYLAVEAGRLERTVLVSLWMIGLALLLAAGVCLHALTRRLGARLRPAQDTGAAVQLETPSWQGFSTWSGITSLVVLLLVCYHYAVPFPLKTGGFRVPAVLCTVSAWLAAWSLWVVVRWCWSPNLADAVLGLASVGFGGVVLVCLPERPVLLVERYPLVFTALVAGLALATGLNTWLGTRVHTLSAVDAPPPRVLLVPRARRMVFMTAALGLLISGMLAIWPRLTAVATTDDSLGRLACGMAADLLLLLALMRAARRLRRVTLHLLGVAAVMLTLAFVLVRVLPFTEWFA